MHSIIKTNIDQLNFLQGIINAVDREEYASYLLLFDFTIGQQTRHILDHYSVFRDQAGGETLDYYLRKRPPALETDKTEALAAIESIILFLLNNEEMTDAPVLVQSEGREESRDDYTTSSLKRELSFLASHTIHHLAILKIMVKFLGKHCHPLTGLAPATIEYRES